MREAVIRIPRDKVDRLGLAAFLTRCEDHGLRDLTELACRSDGSAASRRAPLSSLFWPILYWVWPISNRNSLASSPCGFLFIALHGGGNAPSEANDRGWGDFAGDPIHFDGHGFP